jgi:dipeptidyl aminopeptidase/acylaminoacyl peptidase
VDDGFTTMVYTLGLFETPSDLYAADIDGSGERRLTDLHADLHQEITLSRAERLLYPSYDGTVVEGWLLYPYGYDPAAGPYPLIVHSHGGPHSASGYGFDFRHQLFAAHGYFVLQTNFRSSTGYGDDFKWATWGAWGDKDGEDVMAGVDYAIAHFAIDPERVASIGHSYGGFMTNWLIARYPDRFIAAASGAGISNWMSDYGTADIARTKETEFFGTPWERGARDRMIRQSPLIYADQVQAATLFINGELDQRVPYSEAEQMYVALKKNGVPAKVIQYEGQPHGIRGRWNAVHRMMHELAWFELWMKR